MNAVSARRVEKVYGTVTATAALQPTSLEIPKGELVVLLGPSGSGKTTLLNLIGGLDRPTSGAISVAEVELGGLDERHLGEFRRTKVGFVFQFFNLLPSLTARENVMLAAELTGSVSEVAPLLLELGLGGLEDRFPAELSGGQQQRVAIARALAKRPDVVLCDEPTGALDEASGAQVVAVLESLARRGGRTVLIVTHNPAIAERADRVIRLKDGEVVSNETRAMPA